MRIVEPLSVLPGTWSLTTRNNPGTAYLWDDQRRIHQLGPDGSLTGPLGTLPDTATGSPGWTVSFHPGEPRYAAVTNDGVCSAQFGPAVEPDTQARWQLSGAIETVVYTRSGACVWAIDRIDSDEVRVWVLDDTAGTLIASAILPDRLRDSTCVLADIPRSDAVTLEFAAGQDGCAVWELHLSPAGEIESRELFPHTCFVQPAWHPDGRTFLTLENDELVFARFSYPELSLIARQRSEAIDFEDESSLPNSQMLYLHDGRALVQGGDDRFYLFDADRMIRVDEAIIAGYEPRPIGEVYEALAEESGRISLVQYWQRIGDLLVATTRLDGPDPAAFVFTENSLVSQLAVAQPDTLSGWPRQRRV